jgi:hypothetical protein
LPRHLERNIKRAGVASHSVPISEGDEEAKLQCGPKPVCGVTNAVILSGKEQVPYIERVPEGDKRRLVSCSELPDCHRPFGGNYKYNEDALANGKVHVIEFSG